VLDALEEHARQVFVEQALAVGAEGGVVPDLVFDVQAHEPAIEQVVVDGLDQQPLAADGEQDLQQQGFQEHLGRYRRAAFARIHTRLRTRRSCWRAGHRPARAACARGAGAIPGLLG